MSGTVTRDAHAATMLTAHALNSLDDHSGAMCCPVCCGPCAALKQMLDAGQLDDVARPYAAGGWDWWDDAHDQVDRARLARVWSTANCGAHR